MTNDENEPWYVWQRVYDAESDGWEEFGYPGVAGADLAGARARARARYLEENPDADLARLSWSEDDDESSELLYDGDETGWFVNQIMLWDGDPATYPE